MAFTTADFDRRLAALERAEAGRFGRPLSDLTFSRVSLARRLSTTSGDASADPARLSGGRPLLLQH